MNATSGVVRLEWDSAFFGLDIGRVTVADPVEHLNAAVREADRIGFDCCYLLIQGEDCAGLAIAQSEGFRVVDLRVTLERPLDVDPPVSDVSTARLSADGDRTWILQLARTRFAFSRFQADPRFPAGSADRMFEAWAARGLDDLRRHTLVIDPSAGFVVCGSDGEAGTIELIAAQPDAPRGTGARLLSAAAARFVGGGYSVTRVVTQGSNVPAMRLYEGAGYRVSSSAYWLHRWGR